MSEATLTPKFDELLAHYKENPPNLHPKPNPNIPPPSPEQIDEAMCRWLKGMMRSKAEIDTLIATWAQATGRSPCSYKESQSNGAIFNAQTHIQVCVNCGCTNCGSCN